MKKTLMTRNRVLGGALGCALVALVIGCPTGSEGAGGGGNTATITLNLPGAQSSSARAVYPPTDPIRAMLTFVVEFSGGPAPDRTITVEPGTTTVRVSIEAGTWHIKTQAFLNGKLYAEGAQTENLKAGNNGTTMLMLHNAGMVGIVFKYQDGMMPDSSDAVLQGKPVTPPSFPSLGAPAEIKITLAEGRLYKLAAGGGKDTFDGWFTDAACTNAWNFANPVTDDMILYGKWIPNPANVVVPLTVPGGSNIVAEALAHISAIGNNGDYELILNTDINNFATVSSANYTNTGGSFTLRGANNGHTITLPSGSTGAIFHMAAGDLTLENIKLEGNASNTNALVYVLTGSFTLNSGGIITGNMSGSTSIGGGVHIAGGTFYLNGGTISDNTCTTPGVYNYSGKGGGVHIATGGAFYMTGGTISGNTNISGCGGSFGLGGGVYIDSGASFVMNGGEIKSNRAYNSGGGVYIDAGGSFSKTGGTIYGFTNGDLNSNFVNNGAMVGYAVYDAGSSRYRDSTAGPAIELDHTAATNSNWNR